MKLFETDGDGRAYDPAFPFRAWVIPQVPMRAFYVPARTREAAFAVVDVLANFQLFLYDNHVMPDYANATGVQYWDVDEKDWLDEDEED